LRILSPRCGAGGAAADTTRPERPCTRMKAIMQIAELPM
jgi:hypothetical protein